MEVEASRTGPQLAESVSREDDNYIRQIKVNLIVPLVAGPPASAFPVTVLEFTVEAWLYLSGRFPLRFLSIAAFSQHPKYWSRYWPKLLVSAALSPGGFAQGRCFLSVCCPCPCQGSLLKQHVPPVRQGAQLRVAVPLLLSSAG